MNPSAIDLDALVSMLKEQPTDPDFSLFDKSEQTEFVESYYKTTGVLPTPEILSRETGTELPAEVGPWSYYLKKLKEEKFVRDALPALQSFNDTYEKDQKRALLQLRDRLMSLVEPSSVEQPVSIVHDLSRYQRFKEGAQRVPTGIQPLDEATGGLSSKDDFVVISARLGVGKSWVAHMIGANMCREGYRVGLYSGEMSEDAVGARFDSIISHISNYALTRGKNVDLVDHMARLRAMTGDLLVMTPNTLHHDARPSDLRRFIKECNLQCIIIDQLDQMSPDGMRGGDDHERKSLLSVQLRALQQECSIPVILVHQLNRAAVGQEADASNLAGSDQIGRDATLVLALTKKEDTLKMKVLKARFFRIPDNPWEFTWDIDKGVLEPKLSAMDAIKAKVKVAAAKQKVVDENQSQQPTAEEDDIW